jgi:hypothetical protein
VAGQAELIVTGDRHPLSLLDPQGIDIVRVGEALARIVTGFALHPPARVAAE